ncbi:mitochondrial ribosome receptor [Komagataella phaffii CBS 7435]|uniref:Protein involved in assembly of mitochondrial respiratory complexes n=2 Tax=Komagataella phaffii TaxID=460519 RepID=C4QVK7_KOMPG|nr:uncharacterized protein PAS_chr1-3_0217 [Komagataella phaffii GS115]AOA61646.1 GQ67_02476T0 [Komagataella phaffii]CAH2445936.1 mitochondrial ribosome receptor [Komagataella phaffii CBS 7435]AOA65513.1 GQ68_02771T0 [Komagataella phaffii GS115]CAY67280.1 Protein involved in assembly of mitochondrial respiratory complexes [Komagataella phaffii GS115]CCA36383.1 mitochondrial ribosome receptor [Komagataella phaffii CBS 7435]
MSSVAYRLTPGLRTRPLHAVQFGLRFKSTTPPPQSGGGAKGVVPSINKIGIPMKSYIPPSFNRLNFLSHPIISIKCLLRRCGLLALNTYQVLDIRKNIGKPDFVLWKNNSIENFILVNKLFANGHLKPLKSKVSSFVFKSLESRLKSLPENTKLDWKLLKFNKPPKLVNLHNFPNDDGSTMCVQVIYKFDTQQRLITVKNGSDATTFDRNLVQYVGFNVDPYSNEVVLAGSLFESDLTTKISDSQANPTQRQLLDTMARNGDIFRNQ